MSNVSRPYTDEEIRRQFMNSLASNLRYWSELKPAYGEDPKTCEQRMSGMVFSILCMLDGVQTDLPAFIVAPLPHPDDKAYRIDTDDNYYPENHEWEKHLQGKIHGDGDSGVLLHEQWSKFCKAWGIDG